MINGTTRTCGLIGNPVEHTMSPVIHNTLAEQLGQNLVYVPLLVEDGYIKEAVEGAYALNLLGCNVTVPYKSQVLPYLKDMDKVAKIIGAVNTLVRVEGGFKGYNTDMPGLYRAMMSDQVAIRGESVLILGAGGVARAVAVLMAGKGAGEIILFNRTIEKAQAIADEVNALAGKNLVTARKITEYHDLTHKKYLAIQATSVGLYPNCDKVVIEDPAFYELIHTGYDLIFNPVDTMFMKMVRRTGGRAYNGLKMLLYQGIIAYELWNKISVDEDTVQMIYDKMQKELSRV